MINKWEYFLDHTFLRLLKLNYKKMSKELKDLIESIDSANQAHSDLEQIIRYLREEVQRLTFTINEQKEIIKDQRSKLNEIEDNNLPGDIHILKEIVSNQREDIIKKDKDIEILKQTLEDITNELENAKKFDEESQELIYANKAIVQLTEENELKEREIRRLEKEIETLQNERTSIPITDSEDMDQRLIDAKKIIFQLTEETGINRVKIESLKADLEDINSKLEESENLNITLSTNIEELKTENYNLLRENEDLIKKIEQLQKEIQDSYEIKQNDLIAELTQNLKKLEQENERLVNALSSNVKITDNLKKYNSELEKELNELKNIQINNEAEHRRSLAQKEEELENLNNYLKKIENANSQLNQTILKLEEQETINHSIKKPMISEGGISLGNISQSLFINMFDLLEKEHQNQIQDLLIHNLSHDIREKRIDAIKLLSMIKNTATLDALKQLIHDDDWIVKLHLINALTKFDKRDILEVLQLLSKDHDIDVREAAERGLKRFY